MLVTSLVAVAVAVVAVAVVAVNTCVVIVVTPCIGGRAPCPSIHPNITSCVVWKSASSSLRLTRAVTSRNSVLSPIL